MWMWDVVASMFVRSSTTNLTVLRHEERRGADELYKQPSFDPSTMNDVDEHPPNVTTMYVSQLAYAELARLDTRSSLIMALNGSASTLVGLVAFVAVILCIRYSTPFAFQSYSRILSMSIIVDILTIIYNYVTRSVSLMLMLF